MGSRLIDTLTALVHSVGGTPAPDFAEQVLQTLASVKLSSDEFVPAYFIDVLGRLARGEPTKGWIGVPKEDNGLSFVLEDLATFVPGATFLDEGTRSTLYVPQVHMKAVVEHPLEGSRYEVTSMAPDDVEALEALEARLRGPPPLIIEGGFDPDEATVRKWAYDLNRRLTDQDEELALHQDRYLPLLVELASDPAGPKSDYIRQILEYFTASRILHLAWRPLAPFIQARDLAQRSQAPAVRDWAERITHVLDHLAGSGPVALPEAMEIARELLVGQFRVGATVVGGELGDWWEFRLEGPVVSSFDPRLYIHRTTGLLFYSHPAVENAPLLAAYAKAPGRGPYFVGQPNPPVEVP